MKLKKTLSYLLSTVLAFGICLPVNTQTTLAATYDIKGSLKAKSIDPETLWTNGTQMIDGSGSLWKFKEYIDGRWSMEGKVEKLAENVVYAGEFITTDGKLLSPLDKWPENKKVKWAATRHNQYAVVDEEGNLWVWGESYAGDLGYLEQDGTVDEPQMILTDVEKVYFFSGGGCAIKKDGTLWSWGPSGPFIKESDKIVTIWFEHTSYGYKEYTTTYTPVNVMNGVKDIWSGVEPIVIKTDNSLYVGNKKIDENVIDVFACLGEDSIDDKFIQTVVYLKEDGTLWGYGMPYHLGLKEGNTSFVTNKFGSFTEKETKTYQSVPIKLMDNVATIISGEHELGFSHRFYVFKKDGSVVEIGLGEQKTISPSMYLYLYYYDDKDVKLPVSEQKTDDKISYGELPDGVYITSDNKLAMEDGTVLLNLKGKDFKYGFAPEKGDWVIVVDGEEYLLSDLQLEATPTKMVLFADVPADAYYFSPVMMAVTMGITSGTSETTFSPNQTCTRAQILAFLWRAAGCPEPTINNPFTDVAASNYYYEAALWAYENGMVTGNQFMPNTPCTRGDSITYIWKAEGKPAANTESGFTDIAHGTECAQAATWAKENGVTSGTTETTFAPDQTCTRAQIVTFLYRAFMA